MEIFWDYWGLWGFIIFVFIIWLWERESPEAREKRKREEEYFKQNWKTFIEESKLTTPAAPKHPQAALFRHAWIRAVILENIYAERNELEKKSLYKGLGDLSAEKYHAVAPEGAYGKIPLEFTPKQQQELRKKEETRLWPPQGKLNENKNLACIYIGKDKNNKPYIGQTLNEPELRWVQHRKEQTGPYKDGQDYVQWDILKGNVSPNELDYWEAYYIGIYDAYEKGYNSNKGNYLEAYNKGIKNRKT